jgi:hypothetical protein
MYVCCSDFLWNFAKLKRHTQILSKRVWKPFRSSGLHIFPPPPLTPCIKVSFNLFLMELTLIYINIERRVSSENNDPAKNRYFWFRNTKTQNGVCTCTRNVELHVCFHQCINVCNLLWQTSNGKLRIFKAFEALHTYLVDTFDDGALTTIIVFNIFKTVMYT